MLWVRFVDEVVAILESSGLQTLKQFKNAKLEDVEIEEGSSQGKRVFVRMALKSLKTEKQGEYFVQSGSLGTQHVTVCVIRRKRNNTPGRRTRGRWS